MPERVPPQPGSVDEDLTHAIAKLRRGERADAALVEEFILLSRGIDAKGAEVQHGRNVVSLGTDKVLTIAAVRAEINAFLGQIHSESPNLCSMGARIGIDTNSEAFCRLVLEEIGSRLSDVSLYDLGKLLNFVIALPKEFGGSNVDHIGTGCPDFVRNFSRQILKCLNKASQGTRLYYKILGYLTNLQLHCELADYIESRPDRLDDLLTDIERELST